MASTLLTDISKNESERARLRSRRKFQMDLQSDMITSFDNGVLEGKREGILEGKREGILEGKREGILEGMYEAKLEIAKTLLDKGISINDIAEITSLPADILMEQLGSKE